MLDFCDVYRMFLHIVLVTVTKTLVCGLEPAQIWYNCNPIKAPTIHVDFCISCLW